MDHLRLIEFTPDDGNRPFVLETRTAEATAEIQVGRANRLAEDGRVRFLWAESPEYWQRKLARALLFGFFSGALLVGVLSWIS